MNSPNERIIELTTIDQCVQAFPVLKQLRLELTEHTYLDLLREREGYKLFALLINNQIVSLAGIGIRTNFYNGRHGYIYDLITDSSHRSFGYGNKLLSYVHHWAVRKWS